MTYIGSGLVVFHEERVLLVLEDRAAKRGLWNFPGGRPELGESLEMCAQREFAEETGIQAKVTRYLGVYETVVGNVDRVLFFVFEGKLTNSAEAVGARWFSRSGVERLARNGRLRSEAISETVGLSDFGENTASPVYFRSLSVESAPSITTR
jgi:8-oxo-dGTP pyrophosphatase MutT (NUDIX family)